MSTTIRLGPGEATPSTIRLDDGSISSSITADQAVTLAAAIGASVANVDISATQASTLAAAIGASVADVDISATQASTLAAAIGESSVDLGPVPVTIDITGSGRSQDPIEVQARSDNAVEEMLDEISKRRIAIGEFREYLKTESPKLRAARRAKVKTRTIVRTINRGMDPFQKGIIAVGSLFALFLISRRK